MPLIIRIIAQRVIAFFLGLLTFLGISPEATIPTDEEVLVRQEEQRQIVEEILEIGNEIEPRSVITAIDEASEQIQEKRVEFENTPTDPAPDVRIERQIETFPVTNTTTQPVVEEVEEEESTTFNLANVMVNIICTKKTGNFTTATTGSGVIISNTGVVLTNAHVAFPFILEDTDNGVECGIYRENIPTFGYRADIMYISEDWVRDNYKELSNSNPRGTGEKDFALLAITGNTNPVLSLPSSFSYARLNTNEGIYTEGRSIKVGGFPGSPTNIFDLTRAGSLKTDTAEIDKILSFNTSNIDVISTNDTHVAQRGSSGGGIFVDNRVIGITVTITRSGGQINALTTSYIARVLKNDLGSSVSEYISGDIRNTARNYISDNSDLAELLLTSF